MARIGPHFAILAALLAAACSGGESNTAANASVEAVPPDEAVPPATNESGNAAETVTAAFPTGFDGRWGLVANDCIEGASDAKGLMLVEGATLRFYESRGIAERLTVESPARVSGEFAFDGEGQRWTKMVTLALANNGKTLVRTETEPPLELRYSKCEG